MQLCTNDEIVFSAKAFRHDLVDQNLRDLKFGKETIQPEFFLMGAIRFYLCL
jgi:hypothetical protein